MPRYYCDYCDTYLTHDSPSVRKQHNSGYKHKANIRAYYQKFEEQQTQILIDQKIKEHLGHYQQIGAAYNQHLASFPGARPRPPVVPLPMLPIQGAAPAPSQLPPFLPMPVLGAPGYGNGPMNSTRPMPPSSMPWPPNGPPMPPPSTSVPPGENLSQPPPSTASGYSNPEAPQNNQ